MNQASRDRTGVQAAGGPRYPKLVLHDPPSRRGGGGCRGWRRDRVRHCRCHRRHRARRSAWDRNGDGFCERRHERGFGDRCAGQRWHWGGGGARCCGGSRGTGGGARFGCRGGGGGCVGANAKRLPCRRVACRKPDRVQEQPAVPPHDVTPCGPEVRKFSGTKNAPVPGQEASWVHCGRDEDDRSKQKAGPEGVRQSNIPTARVCLYYGYQLFLRCCYGRL